MSLILQALKKAEAERGIGRVPTLDQVAAPEPPADPPRRAALVGALVLGFVGVLGVGAWWLLREEAPAVIAAAPPAAPTVAAPPAAAPQAAAPPAAAPPATAPPAAAPRATAPTPASPTPAAAPASAAAAPPAGSAAPAPAPRPARTAAARALPAASAPPPAAARAPARAAPAAPPPDEPPLLHELPVAIRQSLPPLTVSGSIWSPQPTERMLIVGGEVRREGDRLGEGLELVSIGQRAAVLRYRGQAFRLPY